MKFCYNCGAQNEDQAVFCKHCGAAQKPLTPPVQPPSSPDTDLTQTIPVLTPSANQPTPSMDQTQVIPRMPSTEPASQFQPPEPPPVDPPKKKSKKGLIITLICVGAALLIAIIVGIFYLRWYLSPEQKLLRSLHDGDLAAAMEIVEDNRSLRRNSEFVDALKSRIAQVQADFADGTMTYKDAQAALTAVKNVGLQELEKPIANAEAYLETLSSSNDAFAQGQTLFDQGKYDQAMEQYLLVTEDDRHYEQAQAQYSASVDKYRSAMLQQAKEHADKGDFAAAVAVLDTALGVLENDADLTQQRSNYQKSGAEKEKSDILAAAEDLADDGEYLAAMEKLNTYTEAHGEDADVTAACKQYDTLYVDGIVETAQESVNAGDYEDALGVLAEAMKHSEDSRLEEAQTQCQTGWADSVAAEVKTLLSQGQHEQAKALINTTLEALPGNETLTQLLTDVESAKPVYLHTLEPINGSLPWNEGDPADPFENTYSGLNNYAILHANKYTGYSEHEVAEIYSAEYKLDKKYDCLNLTVTPYADFGAEASSYIQIFVNGNHRYTSKWISQKTEPFNFPAIDISDADYLKIVVHVGGYGCIMISEVTLSNPIGFESKLKTGYTPLHQLKTFNGGFSWHEGYPRDSVQSDYANVWNYTILHSAKYTGYSEHERAATHSAEYYVNKKYKSISFDIAPHTHFEDEGSAVVKVYVDDKLIYTSKTLTQKTQRFNTGAIDLSNATYVKIVVEVQGYSCTILSNVLLANGS